MARYIDADVLKERLEKCKASADDLFGMGVTRGVERAETTIDMIPTALRSKNGRKGRCIMTDNEIIKALERCGQHRECCYCNSVEECGNKRVLAASTIDLINRQKAEIERLKNIKKTDFLNVKEQLKLSQSEIGEIRAEAIRETLLEVDNRLSHYGKYDEIYKYTVTDVLGEVEREMVGEDNDRP